MLINETILFNINEPINIRTIKIPINLGINVSVCSCIDVTVWKILTISPIINYTINNGPAEIIIVHIASLAIFKIASSVISYLHYTIKTFFKTSVLQR